MSEWKEYKFSDFVEVNPFVQIMNRETVSFVEMKDLTDGLRYCEPKQEKKLAGGMRFQNGDTLFARITPCLENGKICQVKNLKDNVGFGSTEFHVFRGKQDISDNDFVFYLCRWEDVRSFAELNFDGTSGRQRVPKQAFNNLYLFLPPLPTQHRIASVLSSLDDKIDLLNRQNATLEKMAETLFRQWFVEGAKAEWKKGKLGDVATIIAGGDKPKVYSEIETDLCTVPIYSNGLENNGLYGFTNIDRINDESITISARGTIGFVCLRTTPYVPIVRLISIIPNKKIVTAKFLYLWAKNQNIMGTGTTQQQLTVPDLSNTEIQIPPLNMIVKFTQTIEPYFEKIKSNTIQIRTLTQMRDTLLPKLMSGEITVKE